MDVTLLVALAALGLLTLVSGAALLLVGRARVSGAVLLASGLVLVGASLLEKSEHTAVAEPLLVGYVLGLAVAVMLHPVPRWQHPVDFVALVVVVGAGVLAAAQPRDADVRGSLGIVVAFAVGTHLWWRLERSGSSVGEPVETRLPLTWLALTLATVGTLSGLVVLTVENQDGIAAAAVIWSVVPPTMYLGTVRPELVDVRSLVVQAVVVLVATIGYISLFVVLESLLEVLGSDRPPVGVLAVLGAIAALTFHPLEVALRGVVDALLFGVRPDPLGAAAEMADQIGDDPEQALRAVRAALVLPYAALELGGRVLAESGDRVTHTREVPLAVGDEGGALVVGLRPGDLSLGADDAVLRLVAQILAQTLRARALAADLQASRGHVVDALEEERRRLRRDLHDGLGPRLSGIAFTADAARNSVRPDPGLAEELLADLRAETATAISDIRELVYGMRPPALDELGLVGALRQQSRSLRALDGRPVAVEFRAAELPELGAAVEVAAYRIVVEALTNVARHSSSPTASVRLEPADGELRVEVLDQGAGAANGRSRWTSGVGISAMKERAAEVGGTLSAAPGEAGGRVLATLPLRSGAM